MDGRKCLGGLCGIGCTDFKGNLPHCCILQLINFQGTCPFPPPHLVRPDLVPAEDKARCEEPRACGIIKTTLPALKGLSQRVWKPDNGLLARKRWACGRVQVNLAQGLSLACVMRAFDKLCCLSSRPIYSTSMCNDVVYQIPISKST